MAREYKTRKKNEGDIITASAAEIGNKPPLAPEEEENVIGSLMIEDESVFKATELLNEKGFYAPKIWLIFQSILGPHLSDHKDSGSIEQDAGIVLLIHRPALPGQVKGPQNGAELILAKNRTGEMGIIMTCNGDLVRFLESEQAPYNTVERIASSANPNYIPTTWGLKPEAEGN